MTKNPDRVLSECTFGDRSSIKLLRNRSLAYGGRGDACVKHTTFYVSVLRGTSSVCSVFDATTKPPASCKSYRSRFPIRAEQTIVNIELHLRLFPYVSNGRSMYAKEANNNTKLGTSAFSTHEFAVTYRRARGEER